MSDPNDFCDSIRAAGLVPPDVIEPGKMQRFPGEGKRRSNTAGWCMLFDDGQGGCFGDWSTGLSEIWQVNKEHSLSPEARIALAFKVDAVKKQAELDRCAKQDKAAIRALTILNDSSPASPKYPYLVRKRINPNVVKNYKGAIVLPIQDFFGKLTSLQFIRSDGSKRLLANGRKKGCFIPVSDGMKNPDRVIICEGWATGCTLLDDEPGSLVLAAIDAYNLESVAVAARCHWVTADILIAGDDDRLTPGNPGATKAKSAATASGARFVLPQWPEGAPDHLSDFNDLAIWLNQSTDGGKA